MTTLHATPYNRDATGFYFISAEEYEDKAKFHFDRFGNLVEEFEIQFVDGDDAALFEACGIDQTCINTWFDDVEYLQDYEKINLYYLVGCAGYSLVQAMDMLDEPCITESSLRDASEELFNECWLSSVPDNLRFYVDYDKFARDCEYGGDMVEFECNGKTYTCVNANGI